MKKVFGYIFIVISVLLLLLALGTISNLLAALRGLVDMFSGELDGYGSGYAIGMSAFWALYIAVMIKLWNTGRRWIREVAQGNRSTAAEDLSEQ